MTWTLYIDESGEEGGLTNIRTSEQSGSCPWFTLGAVLIKDDYYAQAIEIIDEIAQTLGKDLHFNNFTHKQKVYAFKKLSEIDAVFFGVISNKNSSSMTGYTNLIKNQSYKYYNKHAQYLFEKVGKYFRLNEIGINDHNIIFEDKRAVEYIRMKNYLQILSQRPYRRQITEIRNINPTRICSKEKHEEKMLFVADGIAHALFQVCENAQLGITETRYLKEIAKKFYSNQNNVILESGIKAINSVSDLNLSKADEDFLINLKSDTANFL